MIGLLCFVLTVLAAPFKSKVRLEAENAALRHQLIVLRRPAPGARLTTTTTLANTTRNPFVVRALRRSGLLAEDLDYHVVRASMVIMFFFFGYQKWFPYEFERLVSFISNGPLIWWLYPAFGHAGASYFLGVSEWTFGSLLFAGFWDKRLGVPGALGSTSTFIATVTIIPFMPDGWDAAAGGNGPS
jgi:uncharacterized membrane protein YphA (DoxX/SURF4 family)